MSSVSASANTNTFPDFLKSLASLAKSNMPSPKELQTKKFAKAKRAKIIAKQRIVQAKKQAKIAQKEEKKPIVRVRTHRWDYELAIEAMLKQAPIAPKEEKKKHRWEPILPKLRTHRWDYELAIEAMLKQPPIANANANANANPSIPIV